MRCDTQYETNDCWYSICRKIFSSIVSGQVIPRIASSVIKPINNIWADLNLVLRVQLEFLKQPIGIATKPETTKKTMQKWKINIKSAAKIGLDWRRNKPPEHHSDYLRNISNLIKRHKPLNRIARTNGFCNRRWIWERSAGNKRIAKRTSVAASKAMMIILIITQNVLYGVPTVFDTH